MSASTAGSGNDQENNHCGIAMSHAYSILAAFQLKDDTYDEEVLLMRNPWGNTGYTGRWNAKDENWTEDLAK